MPAVELQDACVAQLRDASKLVATDEVTGVGDTVKVAVGALAGGRTTPGGRSRSSAVCVFAV